MTTTPNTVGIRLRGGPGRLDGWQQVYPAFSDPPWPPPEEIVAFEHMGSVAVALPEDVPADFPVPVTRYRKVEQSRLPDDDTMLDIVVRGAVYEAEAS